MSKKVNYEQMEQCIRTLTPYEHGSSYAVLAPDERDYEVYKVYSYTTLMMVVDVLSNQVKYYNTTKYSQTTSRLQKIIGRCWNVTRFSHENYRGL